ncbi:MAG: exodeoxyribonuclease VII large subunit [Oscillospiraceae bacterium]|nr:exodeoxyribonuclease VII large subunit [Oscillospiraceae bacterium]
MQDSILSVSQLNERVKAILDSDPVLNQLLVRGELSNYKIYPSGHHYFTLKDSGGALRCVMFRSDASRLRFRPENGMNVICQGRVTVYPRDGAYQLYVSEIHPDGMGDLYVAFEQMKERLQKEGLFDPAHKKLLPAMPERIAVITSGAGAAVRDIIRILGQRWPLAKVTVLPVRVQGEGAAAEIAAAIRDVNTWKEADLIITGRGGGSMEDLWAFNEEIVARAIYGSLIPVISAVGHEPDVTISDFVADLRASTPSNAAELAVPDQDTVSEKLLSSRIRLGQVMRKTLQDRSSRLQELSSRPVMESPYGFIQQRRQDLDHYAGRLVSAEERILAGKKQRYIHLASSLEAMSPLRVLSRGFSVTTDEKGKILHDSVDAEPGDPIHVRLEHGVLYCRVEKKTEDENT